MTRRLFWLGAGVVLGAAGTVWLRRRLEGLAERFRPARVAGDVASGVESRVRGAAGHVRSAVAGGRDDAQAREAQLRRQLEPD